jgi:hypothetical protein
MYSELYILLRVINLAQYHSWKVAELGYVPQVCWFGQDAFPLISELMWFFWELYYKPVLVKKLGMFPFWPGLWDKSWINTNKNKQRIYNTFQKSKWL